MAERIMAANSVVTTSRHRVDYLLLCDRVILWGFVFAFVGIPLAFGGHITNDMFDLPKLVWMRFATVIVVTAWMIKTLISRQLSWRRTPLDLPVLAFLIANILATVHTVSPNLSLHGEYRRYEGILAIGNYIVLFYLAANLSPLPRGRGFRLKRIEEEIAAELESEQLERPEAGPGYGEKLSNGRTENSLWADGPFSDTTSVQRFESSDLAAGNAAVKARADRGLNYFKVMLAGQVGAGVVVAIYAISQRLGRDFVFYVPVDHKLPIISTFGNMNFLAAYLGMVIPIALGLFLENRRIVSKVSLAVAMGLMAAVVFLTTSRGAWLGLAIGVILLLVLAGSTALRRNRVWLGLAVALLMLAPILNWSTVVARVQETAHVAQVGSAQYRLRWWSSSLPLIADNFALGTGVSTLEVVFPKYASVEYASTEGKDSFLDKAHNEFIQFATTTGLVGLGAYLWVLGGLAMFVWRTWRREDLGEKRKLYLAGLISGVVVYLVQNQFSFGVIGIASLFWMMLGMIVVLGADAERKFVRPIQWNFHLQRNIRRVAGLAAVAMAVVIIFYSAEMIVADNLYRQAQQDAASDRLDRALAKYQRIVELNPYQTEYWRGLAATYLDKIKASENHPGASLDTQKAEWFGEAVKGFRKVIDLNPAPFDYLFLAQTYAGWDSGHDSLLQAYQNYKLAVQAYPYYYYGNRGLGEIAYRLGRYEEAAEAYQTVTLVDPNDVNAYFQLAYSYSQLNQDDEARASLLKVTALDPYNYLAHFHLGVIYERRGDREEAIREFQTVLSTKPPEGDSAQYGSIETQAQEALKRLGL